MVKKCGRGKHFFRKSIEIYKSNKIMKIYQHNMGRQTCVYVSRILMNPNLLAFIVPGSETAKTANKKLISTTGR